MTDERHTRLLIPAPSETRREAQIDWYEARVYPGTKSVQLVAFSQGAVELARAETQWIDGNRVTTVISQERTRVTVDFSLSRSDSGLVQVNATINGREFAFSGQPEEAKSVRMNGKPDFEAAEAKVLREWGRLSDPVSSLARATQATSGEAHHAGVALHVCLRRAALVSSLDVVPSIPSLAAGKPFWEPA